MSLSPLRGGFLFSFFSLLIALFRCLKWGLPVYARLTLNSLYSSRQPILKILLPQPPYCTWLPTLLLFLAHLITSGNHCTPSPLFCWLCLQSERVCFSMVRTFCAIPFTKSYLFLFYAYECFCYMFVWSPSVCLVPVEIRRELQIS